MKKVIHELCTTNYTEVYSEEDSEIKYNAPHNFVVLAKESGQVLCTVDFQKGPIKEFGVNGVANEDLILMVLTRLEAFQLSEYSCIENAMAIANLEDALSILRSRTNKRIERGVEGTHII